MKCPICLGIGWVCENHADKPWDKELGCECGAGVPCKCNSAGEPGIDEPDTSQVVVEEDEISRHQMVAFVKSRLLTHETKREARTLWG